MKKGIFLTLQLLFVCLVLGSCEDQDKIQQELKQKALQHNDSIFNFLQANWNFKIEQNNSELNQILQEWKIWEEFSQELAIKPVTSIGAYQNKIKILDNKLQSLTYLKYPEPLNSPDIKARITTLLSSIKDLNMFLHLNPVDIKNLDSAISKVDKDLSVLMDQMQKNLSRPSIKEYLSDQDLQNLFDTVRRANPQP
ncbi:hypothetical protein [Myroides sp. LJL119]